MIRRLDLRIEKFIGFAGWVAWGTVVWTSPSWASASLADRLGEIRKKVDGLEQGLLEGAFTQKTAKLQVKKIQKLLELQKLERTLGEKRLSELEHTVLELESRKASLNQKMSQQRQGIRHLLTALESSNRSGSNDRALSMSLPEYEKIEAPRRKVMANLVDRGLKEIEILRADLEDAGHLESRIQDEKQQLAYLIQDLKEQASVLELNRQLQVDLVRRKKNERISQLQNYQRLKSAEAQVEHLIGEFNARKELERAQEAELEVSKTMAQGAFFKMKGKLPFPVAGGKVVSGFGRSFDPKSGLYVFKKGVDIEIPSNQPVRAISSGKVAFSGVLPHFGQVVIIDHGEHFYSLCGHLGSVLKKSHEWVNKGDSIGVTTGDSRTPLYFEIRARNVAVNPLQWVFN